jgi:histidyl-tRNA synthetase
MFEDIAVFHRGIGEASDVARKEMYTFTDRGDRTYALRPEGTASVVRAFVQHNPTPPWKAWYATPAFRYERPQAGRYRQHHQVGVEALGSDDPYLDVEVISLAWRFYEEIGLRKVTLMVNSMGHAECRGAYVTLLSAHLTNCEARLCEEHQKVWSTNPLRVLDCKKAECVSVVHDGPTLPASLCDECRDHFSVVTAGLDALGIPWTANPNLVRGFDYYTRTTFEFASDALANAQNAIGGGGRYDRLAEDLGGSPTPGVGFGSGIERLVLALEAEQSTIVTALRAQGVFAFVVDTTGGEAALILTSALRLAGVSADRAFDGRSMKSQLKAADRSGARWALLVGDQEAQGGYVTLRDLRASGEGDRQYQVPRADVVAHVAELQGKNNEL